MPPPNRLDPLEALRVLTTKMNRRAPAVFATEEAPKGFLAESIEFETFGTGLSASHAPTRVASRNGYALPRGVQAGDVCWVLGTLTTDGPRDADGFPPRSDAEDPGAGAHASARGVWRVETGAAVPDGFDRVIAVRETVLVARRAVRLERLPESGEGSIDASRLRFEAGSFLSSRLRSLFVEHGVRSVSVRPPFSVAVGIVGDDILDPGAPPEPGRRHDATGPWLEEAVRRLGLDVIGLGLLSDSPDAVRDAILHVRGRADVLVLSGGVGDGLTDRTVESIRRFEAHVVFDGLDLEGCSGLCFAKTMGIDIVGLGGKPLEAACGFDLFLRAALLARLGAAAAEWDWSRALLPLEPGTSSTRESEASWRWKVAPAARTALPTGEIALRPLDARTPWVPQVPGQEGWAVQCCHPETGLPSGQDAAYFQPTSVS